MVAATGATAWPAPITPAPSRRPPTRSPAIDSRLSGCSPTSRPVGPSEATERRSPASPWRRISTKSRKSSVSIRWSCGLEACIKKVVEGSGFLERRRSMPRGRGLGFAISSYLSGAGTAIYWNDMPHSEVQLKVDRGGVTAYCGAMDIGQGSDSVLASIVAEELGLQPFDIRLVTADTDTTPIDLGSYSSRVTFMAGNAALEAARKMRAMLVDATAAKMGRDPAGVDV